MDDATPSGNGIAAQALARLGHLLGEVRYIEAAEAAIRAAWIGMERILRTLRHDQRPRRVAGACSDHSDTRPSAGDGRLAFRATRHYAPARQVFVPSEETRLPGLLAVREAPEQGVLAYVCEGHRCDAPATDFASFERALAAGERVPGPRE